MELYAFSGRIEADRARSGQSSNNAWVIGDTGKGKGETGNGKRGIFPSILFGSFASRGSLRLPSMIARRAHLAFGSSLVSL